MLKSKLRLWKIFVNNEDNSLSTYFVFAKNDDDAWTIAENQLGKVDFLQEIYIERGYIFE